MSENFGSIKWGVVGLQCFKESVIFGMYWGDRYYQMILWVFYSCKI